MSCEIDRDPIYRFAFNQLAEVILYGNILNPDCYTRDECEKTYNALYSVIERMKKLIDKMDNSVCN